MEVELNIVKVLVPWIVSFLFGITLTPIILHYLHKYKVWRKESVDPKKVLLKDKSNRIFNVINKVEKDNKTPRMGGIVIVFSVILTISFFWILSFIISGNPSGDIDILSRGQTWLPLAAFIIGAILGFIDDLLTIKNIKIGKHTGLPLVYRIIAVVYFASFSAWWFYEKLNYSEVLIPFYGYFDLGVWFIPFFVLVFLSVFATSNIDGLDGLSGGIMSSVFTAVGFIAFFQGLINISAFSFVIGGSILAFLWFNIMPAKFYMTEIGYNALSFSLVILVFLTDTVLLLPVIAFILFINLITTVIQVFSIRVFKKRIFKVAPLHHHFEVLGWSQTQIVLRYWIITVITSLLGIVLAIISV